MSGSSTAFFWGFGNVDVVFVMEMYVCECFVFVFFCPDSYPKPTRTAIQRQAHAARRRAQEAVVGVGQELERAAEEGAVR